MSVKLAFGKESTTGEIIHIENVDKADNRQYMCCGCGIDLTPVKSEARKKDWHFRHKDTANITSCRSTALHDYAVQLIVENNTITISKELTISYTNPRKEIPIFSKRSDVTVLYENIDAHFEVLVTHDLDQEKIDIYKQQKIRCVRIDLSDPTYLSVSSSKIKDAVLYEPDTKTIVY